MYNYKIIIQYEGTKYNGWQKQGNTENTIQVKIEDVLSKLSGEKVEVSASGRTDSGVHALGQVANFKLSEKINIDEYLVEINKYLPKDIRVISMEEVNERFHSRLNAKSKTYLYRIDNSKFGHVFERKYSLRIEKKLNVDLMRKAAKQLIGMHDFKSFCTKSKMNKSTIRNIFGVEIVENSGIIEIRYTGDGFLYNMSRIMTGTLIEVGLKNIEPEKISEIFELKDREKAGFTAPSEGLFLVKVEYE